MNSSFALTIITSSPPPVSPPNTAASAHLPPCAALATSTSAKVFLSKKRFAQVRVPSVPARLNRLRRSAARWS
jgi:hypothetical protein